MAILILAIVCCAFSCCAAGVPGFTFCRTVQETLVSMTNLSVSYPSLVQLTNFGTTHLGNPMMGLVLTSQAQPAADKYSVMFLGHVHAYEVGPGELEMRFAEELAYGYATNADTRYALDFGAIYIVPIVNVDRRLLVDAGTSTSEKNMNDDDCGPQFGVNLNRNFPFAWGLGDQSSSNGCNVAYLGTAPASESETRAVTNFASLVFADQRGPELTDAAGPNATGILVDMHTPNSSISYQWSHIETDAPDEAALLTFARKLRYFTSYSVGHSYDLGLGHTAGTANGWAYGDRGLCSVTWELDSPSSGTAFTNAVNLNLPAMRWVIKSGYRPYLSPSGPEVVTVSIAANGAITATADGSRNAEDADQAISAARYSLDKPSWLAPSTSSLTVSSSGPYTADISGTVSITGIAGQHLVFVEAQGANSVWGVPTVGFLNIQNRIGALTVQQLKLQ